MNIDPGVVDRLRAALTELMRQREALDQAVDAAEQAGKELLWAVVQQGIWVRSGDLKWPSMYLREAASVLVDFANRPTLDFRLDPDTTDVIVEIYSSGQITLNGEHLDAFARKHGLQVEIQPLDPEDITAAAKEVERRTRDLDQARALLECLQDATKPTD